MRTLRAQMYRKDLLSPCFSLVCSLTAMLKFWVDEGSPCPLNWLLRNQKSVSNLKQFLVKVQLCSDFRFLGSEREFQKLSYACIIRKYKRPLKETLGGSSKWDSLAKVRQSTSRRPQKPVEEQGWVQGERELTSTWNCPYVHAQEDR